MKRKVIVCLLSAIIVCGAISLAACGHEHSYKSTVVSPTCTEEGYTVHKCDCGDSYTTDATSALGHEFTEYHVAYGRFVCSRCHTPAPYPTEEVDTLDFTLKEDDTYEVSGIGSMAYASFNIPSVYSGKPVTSIGVDAFKDNGMIQSIVISDGIEVIGDGAFSGCQRLYAVIVPQTVKELGEGAFDGCVSLGAFSCTGVEKIGVQCFYHCDALYDVSLGDKLSEIGDGAFYGCLQLSTLKLGKSLKSIGNSAFVGSGLKNIEYVGSKSDWVNVEKGTVCLDKDVTVEVGCADGVIEWKI